MRPALKSTAWHWLKLARSNRLAGQAARARYWLAMAATYRQIAAETEHA